MARVSKLGGIGALPFWAVHVAALVGVLSLGWSWSGFLLAVAMYYGRMFFVTAGYHRYFSHRSFKTSRAMQLVLAVGATLSAQKGVLWWAANHRRHHRYADVVGDVHSPRLSGLWWAHVGWILSPVHRGTDWRRVRDFARFRELRWLNRHYLVPPIALAALLTAVGGIWALVWGFFVSTTLLWHGTFSVNSLAHVIGRRRFETLDDSRNNAAVALLTLGEGWHNNHHHHQWSVRQGLRWWEIDVTYYALLLLERCGLVWELRHPPPNELSSARVGRFEPTEAQAPDS